MSTYRLEFHNKQVYLFNDAGRLTTMRDKQGNELAFAYTVGGNLNTVTDTRDRVAVFSYNGAQGRLNQVEVRNPAGTAMLRYTYTYTGTTPARLTSSRLSYAGGVSSTVDTVNVDARTTYTYDTNGRLLRVKDPRETTTTTDGGSTEFSYDLSGRVRTLKRLTDSTSSPDSVTTFSYDTDTGSATPCNTKGATRTTVDGERTDVTDTTTYCADQHGRVQRTVDAKGNVRSATWGPNSNIEQADMSGLDTVVKVARDLRDAYGDRFYVHRGMEERVGRGELGAKTGKGFYEHG
jgi:YD repeat-containing protein